MSLKSALALVAIMTTAVSFAYAGEAESELFDVISKADAFGQADDEPVSKVSAVVQWQEDVVKRAEQSVGKLQQCIEGWTTCLVFARETYNKSMQDTGNSAYKFANRGSAKQALNELISEERIATTSSFSDAPIGSVVFWSNGTYGHVAIKVDDVNVVGHGNSAADGGLDCANGTAPIQKTPAKSIYKGVIAGYLATPAPPGGVRPAATVRNVRGILAAYRDAATGKMRKVSGAAPDGSEVVLLAVVTPGQVPGMLFRSASNPMLRLKTNYMVGGVPTDIYAFKAGRLSAGDHRYEVVVGAEQTVGNLAVR